MQFFVWIYCKILFQIISFTIWKCGEAGKGKDLTYNMEQDVSPTEVFMGFILINLPSFLLLYYSVSLYGAT